MKKSIVLFFLMILAVSCTYENEEELFPVAAECETEMISYSAYIRPLADQNCAYSGCHAGQFPSANLNLTTYEGLKSIADDSQLVGRTTGERGNIMPHTGALPNCDVLKITSWVQAGAPNN